MTVNVIYIQGTHRLLLISTDGVIENIYVNYSVCKVLHIFRGLTTADLCFGQGDVYDLGNTHLRCTPYTAMLHEMLNQDNASITLGYV